MNRSTSPRIAYYLFLPALIVLFAVAIYPTFHSLYLSLSEWSLRTADTPPYFVGLSNYIEIFRNEQFYTVLRNTLMFSITAVFIETILGIGIALLLNKDLTGIPAIRTIILVPMVMTPVAVAFIWKMLLDTEFGVINYVLENVTGVTVGWLTNPSIALGSVMLVDIWQWTPFLVLVILSGLKALPREPFEAAEIDGASRFKSFRHVTLPLLKPILLVAILLRLMDCLKIFDQIYVLTYGGPGSSTETMSLYAYKIAFKYFRTGSAASVSYILLIMIIMLAYPLIRTISKRREYE